MFYLRKVRVRFPGGFVINPGDSTLDQIKVAFSVTKDLSSTQNDGFVEIWNLNANHRNSVGKELKDIEIEAGYIDEGNVGIIARAQIRDVAHRPEDADTITRIDFGDGDKAYRRATISKTLPAGTKVTDVVEELYKSLEEQGAKRGEWKFPDAMKELKHKRPVSMHGDARAELDMIGRSHSFYHSIQDGTMEIIPSDGYLGGVVVLAPYRGLVGVPTLTDNGVRAQAHMMPKIRPGRRVRIESDTLEMNAADSLYRVSSCTYEGDNYDGDFQVAITGEAMKGDSKIDEGIL